MAITTRPARFGRVRVELHPQITPQQMRPESRLGAKFSGKPRYNAPTAAQLDAATDLCFRYGLSADVALAMVGSPGPGTGDKIGDTLRAGSDEIRRAVARQQEGQPDAA